MLQESLRERAHPLAQQRMMTLTQRMSSKREVQLVGKPCAIPVVELGLRGEAKFSAVVTSGADTGTGTNNASDWAWSHWPGHYHCDLCHANSAKARPLVFPIVVDGLHVRHDRVHVP